MVNPSSSPVPCQIWPRRVEGEAEETRQATPDTPPALVRRLTPETPAAAILAPILPADDVGQVVASSVPPEGMAAEDSHHPRQRSVSDAGSDSDSYTSSSGAVVRLFRATVAR